MNIKHILLATTKELSYNFTIHNIIMMLSRWIRSAFSYKFDFNFAPVAFVIENGKIFKGK